jgi:NodT family efflux transporter outer membrane factor (OMF) lipoprotein
MSDSSHSLRRVFPCSPRLVLTACALAFALAGCAVGPDFTRPETAAPDDWNSWRSADDALRAPLAATPALPSQWWLAFGDPVLNQLQQRAVAASPDLRTAALRYAQARVQRGVVAAQRAPEIDASGGITRQRQSEYGAGTRMIDAIGGDRETLAKALSEPFTLYQAGFDASWELDLWGRVRRSIEAADADVVRQAALLDLARLTLASDVARNYFELRTAQRQIRLAREDIAALEDRMRILAARAQGGTVGQLDLEQQRADLADTRAQLPPLLAQAAASINQIALLLGERPGALRDELADRETSAGINMDGGKGAGKSTTTGAPALPDLALGLPSEVARRRPDIRAAEARLHRATANIGVAQADLYPSISLGAHLGLESYLSGEFSDWGSRAWSIGPSLSLPLFDHGRRKSVVELRKLEQQEAAVNFQQTVLKAWQEIDDALNAYTAERQQARQLAERARSAGDAYKLALARYEGGAVDYTVALDSQRRYLQARRDLAASEGRLATRYVTVNKAIGNVPRDASPASARP